MDFWLENKYHVSNTITEGVEDERNDLHEC